MQYTSACIQHAVNLQRKNVRVQLSKSDAPVRFFVRFYERRLTWNPKKITVKRDDSMSVKKNIFTLFRLSTGRIFIFLIQKPVFCLTEPRLQRTARRYIPLPYQRPSILFPSGNKRYVSSPRLLLRVQQGTCHRTYIRH